MEITCKTNLDLFNEVWPTELPCRPMKGDYIQSSTEHPQYRKDENGLLLGGMPTHYCSIELEVGSITFEYDGDNYVCCVELHDKSFYKRSLLDFYKYYAPIVNKSVSYFI